MKDSQAKGLAKRSRYSELDLRQRQIEEMLERRRKMKASFVPPDPHRFDR